MGDLLLLVLEFYIIIVLYPTTVATAEAWMSRSHHHPLGFGRIVRSHQRQSRTGKLIAYKQQVRFFSRQCLRYYHHHPPSMRYMDTVNNDNYPKVQMKASSDTIDSTDRTHSTATIDMEQISNNTIETATSSVAKFIPLSTENLIQCGQRLFAGSGLVAFPTETVYGLGCNALDPIAIAKVFAAKERPSTDPLIAHVLSISQAMSLWDIVPDSIEGRILSTIGTKFWPGPLTLVARANQHIVPSSLMANTSYCAVRVPSYPVARALLLAANDAASLSSSPNMNDSQCGCPIAAPSANKFGHVSPTTAQHVYDDLHREDVWILEDYIEPLESGNNVAQSRVGVESTVAKLEKTYVSQSKNQNCIDDFAAADADGGIGHEAPVCTYTLTVLRQGAVSASALALCLKDAGFHTFDLSASALPTSFLDNKNDLNVTLTKDAALDTVSQQRYRIIVDSSLNVATEDHVPHVAPGQTIRHYSPNVPCFMISRSLIQSISTRALAASTFTSSLCETSTTIDECDVLRINDVLKKAVIVDFGGTLSLWEHRCLAYRDLSPTGDSAEACTKLFDTLRWSERVPHANQVFVPEIVTLKTTHATDKVNDDMGKQQPLRLALKDRLKRAASGLFWTDSLSLAGSKSNGSIS
jgi:L-threonylcarbamoyladenylate synthase